MKLDEMKVQYDRNRDDFSKTSDFTLQKEKPNRKPDISGIAVKIGLCASVLILAFVIRLAGYGSPKNDVAAASTNTEPEAGKDTNDLSQVGALHFVDAGALTKWAAPVAANDIELLRDGSLLRFTATDANVSACMAGTVLTVGEDVQYGKTVRIQSEDDRETLYYGFSEINVREGDRIAAGDCIGTVSVGRSIYLKVLEKGEPQDPTAYVDLSLNRE